MKPLEKRFSQCFLKNFLTKNPHLTIVIKGISRGPLKLNSNLLDGEALVALCLNFSGQHSKQVKLVSITILLSILSVWI